MLLLKLPWIAAKIGAAFILSHLSYWWLLYQSPVDFPRAVERLEDSWRDLCEYLIFNWGNVQNPGDFELAVAALRTQITGKELVIIIALALIYWFYAVIGKTLEFKSRSRKAT